MRTQAMTGLPGVASKTRNGKAFIYPPTQSNRELIRTNREFVGVNREFIEPITDTLTTPSQMRFSVEIADKSRGIAGRQGGNRPWPNNCQDVGFPLVLPE